MRWTWLTVSARCSVVDDWPAVLLMLNLWISLVSLASCTASNFKTDCDRVHGMDMTNGKCTVQCGGWLACCAINVYVTDVVCIVWNGTPFILLNVWSFVIYMLHQTVRDEASYRCASSGKPAYLLYTLSAIQIFILLYGILRQWSMLIAIVEC